MDLVRPIGNMIARIVFREKAIESDSILSDAIGVVVLVMLVVLIVYLGISAIR